MLVEVRQDLSLDPSPAAAAAPAPLLFLTKHSQVQSLFELGKSVDIPYHQEVAVPSKLLSNL